MKCAICGYNDIGGLQIDHINNDGSIIRKRLKQNKISFTGNSYYRWLIKNNFPSGHQVLCANCNWLKRTEV